VALLTVRSLDDDLQRRLQIRAARSGRSMEEEVRAILRDALAEGENQGGLGSRVHARVIEASGGVDLNLPPRSVPRPALFSEDAAR
jgi:antitoxin FitA